MESAQSNQFRVSSTFGLFLGPLAAALILWVGAPADMDAGTGKWPDAWVVLALLVLMTIWWVTEAIPIPVTSLLPLVFLPLFGVSPITEVSKPYMHPIVVLLLGGFIFAKAIEKWGLHERIALHVVYRAGGSPAKLIGGFMIAAAILSMWVSNSATAIMMTPIALSVAAAVENSDSKQGGPFTVALLLAIAYACSIGGLGTPIGTPTNLIVLGYLNEHSNSDISFAQWMLLGLPVVGILLPLAWFVLTRWFFRMPKLDITEARSKVLERIDVLGPMSWPEWRTLFVFLVIASLWFFRRPLNEFEISIGAIIHTPLSGLTDHVVAIIAVFLCFLIPAGGKGRNGQALLDWSSAEGIPWGVLLLFGGGMSLAGAISSSGLSSYIGGSLSVVTTYPTIVIILIVTTMVLFLTEVTSNIATASALMPVFGALAIESNMPLEMFAAPIALAASCAFMLPMATGPNAVAFSTGRFTLATMAMAGFRINLIAIGIITLVGYYLAPMVLR